MWANFGQDDGLPSSDVYSIAALEKDVWAGLDGSVARFVESNQSWVALFPPGLAARVTSIAIGKGEVWFGTFGSGIFRYQDGEWTSYTKRDGLADDRVEDIAIDGSYLYAATVAGASRLPLSAQPARFQTVRKTDGLPDEGLSSVCVLGDRVWFGSRAHGVLGLDASSFSYKKQVSIEQGLSDSRVLSLASDGQYLWVGTGAGGVCRYDPAEESIVVYNKSTGLADNLVGSVATDSSVWCGSWGSGVTALDKDGTTTIYDRSKGLADNDVRDIAVGQREVWFATAGGVSRFTGKVAAGRGGVPVIYVVVGVIVIGAIAVPLLLRGRSHAEKTGVKKKKMPYELCGGEPAENLCPFCRYNVVRAGKHYCSRYRVSIPFE